MKIRKKNEGRILYMSTFPPRECGIATFTKDLTKEMDKKFNPTLKSKILAINENGSSFYNYNRGVIYQINESDIEDYIESAKRINNDDKIKLVSIQHTFGIFGGGDNGEFLISFLEHLNKPCVVTFHTVIPFPDGQRKKMVQAIAKRSSAIVVMAENAINILNKEYNIPREKLYLIHHGVPNIPFKKDVNNIKKSLGIEGKFVLSTFGLINRGKGVEYVIKALPNIVKKYPNLTYLVIGETHPIVRKREGESYRNELTELVKKLGLRKHVRFYNKYLTLDEIILYLRATDIYVYPVLDPYQIVSGTLAYALSSGTAVIGTPSLYAREMLKDGRGIIVKFKDSKSISKAILKIVSDKSLRKNIENKAYNFSRRMLWTNVARNYLEVFKKIIEVNDKIGVYKFPRIKIKHLITMTDDTGIIQHAKHSISDRSTGYTLDDNARALIVAAKHYDRTKSSKSLALVNRYLSFIYHMQKNDGLFHNLLSYDRRFMDNVGSEDSYGRVIWGLGVLLDSNVNDNIKKNAKFIIDNALKNLDKLKAIRPKAYSIIGLYHYYKSYKYNDLLQKIDNLARDLLKNYKKYSTESWSWFEESITYSNGTISEALFLAYELTGKKDFLDTAQKSLSFLTDLVIIDNKLVPIGHNGWYNKEERRAFYDQQPIDASAMVQAYMTAFRVTKDESYREKAALSYHWFLGKNSINQVIYDESTGGCYDGLLPDCVNLNQGAESTISHLLARFSLEE